MPKSSRLLPVAILGLSFFAVVYGVNLTQTYRRSATARSVASLASLNITSPTAPTFTQIYLTAITSTTADLNWSASQPGYLTVELGQHSQRLSPLATAPAGPTSSGVFPLTNLAPNQRYYLRLNLRDTSGLTTVSPIYQFKTDSI